MSALDDEFQRLGLTRPGRTVRQLHVTPDMPDRLMSRVDIPWKGKTSYGYRTVDVVRVHDKMWPACPWAARGECEIERKRAEA